MKDSKDPIAKLSSQLGFDLRAASRTPAEVSAENEANYRRWRQQVWMTFALFAASVVVGFALSWWAALPIGGWATYRFIQHYRLASRTHREIDEAVRLLDYGAEGEAQIRAMGFDPDELRQTRVRGDV